MAEFKEIPSFEIAPSGDWVLVERLVYLSDIIGLVIVPAGFKTDLASVPKLVPRFLIDINEKHRLAAVVHDYLVRKALTRYERARGDRVFLEAMKECGVAWWKRTAMFLAVRTQTVFKRFPK